MDKIRADDGDPETWDVHHWQDVNPVHTEALLQLTCGGPQIVYHGGLLHVRVRYYDALARRPGLPEDVAALVSALDADSTTVELVNASPLHTREVILQAGAFGEHRFTTVTVTQDDAPQTATVAAGHVKVTLPPGRSTVLHLGTDRYVNTPSYRQPTF